MSDLEKLFLGDWHTIVRDPLDLLRVSCVVGAVVLALRGDAHAAAQFALTAVAVLVARTANVPRLFDWGFCVAMAFDGWAYALQLFAHVRWYGDVVHMIRPCLLAVVLYIALAWLDLVPDPATAGKPPGCIAGMGLLTVWIAVTIASFCESCEWMVDDRFGRPFLAGPTRTIADADHALLGSAIAGLVLAAWAAAELPTRRRPRPSAGRPA
jgi:hypothetical protein